MIRRVRHQEGLPLLWGEVGKDCLRKCHRATFIWRTNIVIKQKDQGRLSCVEGTAHEVLEGARRPGVYVAWKKEHQVRGRRARPWGHWGLHQGFLFSPKEQFRGREGGNSGRFHL